MMNRKVSLDTWTGSEATRKVSDETGGTALMCDYIIMVPQGGDGSTNMMVPGRSLRKVGGCF
jgi:hypothetical protein